MSANKHGLGRGIDVLFRNTPASAPKDSEEHSSSTLPLAVLRPSPYQPRRVFEDQPLQELAESIRSQGIVQPLLVRPISGGTHYEIIAGERRFRAAKLVGLSEVPVVIRSMTDDEALTVALIENLQREDLNPLEEAEAMQALRERLGESQEMLASRIGKSRSAVANALRLLQLPEDMRQALAGDVFTPGHARAVLSLSGSDVQRMLYEAIISKQLSVRDAESAVQHYKRTGELPAALVSESARLKPAGPRSPKPELIRDVQRVLRETLGAKVTVSGSGDMGRVTIPYESPEHLAMLMRLLCSGQMQDEDNAYSLQGMASADNTSASDGDHDPFLHDPRFREPVSDLAIDPVLGEASSGIDPMSDPDPESSNADAPQSATEEANLHHAEESEIAYTASQSVAFDADADPYSGAKTDAEPDADSDVAPDAETMSETDTETVSESE